jgi:hypothetical protein
LYGVIYAILIAFFVGIVLFPITAFADNGNTIVHVTATGKCYHGAGTGYRHKDAKEAVGAQANPLGKAVYKKGTVIEVSEIIKKSDKEIWGRTADGYVALVCISMYDRNRYVKYIRGLCKALLLIKIKDLVTVFSLYCILLLLLLHHQEALCTSLVHLHCWSVAEL